MKQKLLNALITAKIITGDNSNNETDYFNAVHNEVKKDMMFGYEDHNAFINPDDIEFLHGKFPNAHILSFSADDFYLLMCQVNNKPDWIATRVFLGFWEGHEKIVEKYQMPFLFTYPNPEYGKPINPAESDPLICLKDVHVYQMTDKKPEQLQLPPHAVELFEKYNAFTEEEKRNSPEAAALMVEMMQYLPQEIQDQMHAMAVEMGLMPEKPSGYLEDGTPLYDLRETAKNLGVSDEGLDTHIAQMHAATDGKYKIDPSKIHRVQ